jgi:hypothetical protein
VINQITSETFFSGFQLILPPRVHDTGANPYEITPGHTRSRIYHHLRTLLVTTGSVPRPKALGHLPRALPMVCVPGLLPFRCHGTPRAVRAGGSHRPERAGF